ncbi:HmuY family protein [Psychroflexus salis]|uniref:HmuY protein n=1 Tax=Psychroflexus salis TaxID=1526574 RepID=A0A916ZZU3_9FLAO|nr:HmuY family protein [Psychroflexus salis]GGE20352.1 hypothetical protein GCM10010831_21800 [Psychroflexus salis]
MKNYFNYLCIFLLVLSLNSCTDDDSQTTTTNFVVAFEQPSIQLSNETNSNTIDLVFSEPAPQEGMITIQTESSNATYNQDFATIPEAVNGNLEISFEAGDEAASFQLEQLSEIIEGEEKSITFSITAVSIPETVFSGNTNLVVNLFESAALGGNLAPEVGGPNQPNQVYIDLSSQQETVIQRDAWDLAFYSGNTNRVVLNYSTQMAVGKTDFYNISEVNESNVAQLIPQISIGNFNPANMEYIDHPSGDLGQTAMDVVSENNEENPVYILNLGNEVGNSTPQLGSVDVDGEAKGLIKIRVLQNNEAYILQYADVNETDYTEIEINKSQGFNYTFFNFEQASTVIIEPEKNKWDINFTVFTNEIMGAGSYMFTDFVLTNRQAEVMAYQVLTSEVNYEEFNLTNIDESNFELDQRSIGSNWRQGGGPGQAPSLREDRFFIIKDTDGNYYKLRFTALVSEIGERGNPAFEYSLVE